ncbi:hypothetical protein [Paraburkholderia madseniana]|jgi:hypothetical protein|nr:hypothetical protein [Paraburkholderia madseniana]
MKSANMIVDIQRRMIGHAALILLIGMLAGAGLLVSLVGGLEWWPGKTMPLHLPISTDAWVRTHLGGMLNAFLIMLAALAMPVVGFDVPGGRRLGWMFVGTGWANTVFYWAAMFAPNRALSFADNRFGSSNLFTVIGLAPALLFTLVSIVAVVLLAYRALR